MHICESSFRNNNSSVDVSSVKDAKLQHSSLSLLKVVLTEQTCALSLISLGKKTTANSKWQPDRQIKLMVRCLFKEKTNKKPHHI